MAQVLGIGGVFFKSSDPKALGWFIDPEGNKVELWQPPDPAGAGPDLSDE